MAASVKSVFYCDACPMKPKHLLLLSLLCTLPASAAVDEAPAVSAADGAIGHSSGNKRKNDAVDTASSAGSTDHDAAVAPANKRQRVGKR